MDAYEAGHYSSLTANATKSLGKLYDLRAFHQLTGEIFVVALVKYVEGNGHMKKSVPTQSFVAFHVYTWLRS